MVLHYIPHLIPPKPFTSAIRLKTCSNTHMLHIKYFPMSQMAAPTLKFCLVTPYLACISGHILPGVKSGTFLYHHAWLGPNNWLQKAMALT